MLFIIIINSYLIINKLLNLLNYKQFKLVLDGNKMKNWYEDRTLLFYQCFISSKISINN